MLTLLVADEDDAWIINRVKEAISQGDEKAAYAISQRLPRLTGGRTEMSGNPRAIVAEANVAMW